MRQDSTNTLIKFVLALLILSIISLGVYTWVFPEHSFKLWLPKRSFWGHKSPKDPNFPGVPTAYEEGKHYQKLSAKITTNPTVQQLVSENPGKIQVIEFFSYACAWCQRLHPIIDQWVDTKPQDVVFYRYPVIFHPGWDKLAKAYYMVEQLGKTRELDQEFFTAIQQNNVNLSDEKLLKDFFIRHGVTEERYNELYNSFATNRAYKKGNEISEAYQVTLSPILIVNAPSGSYLLLASMAGSEKGVMEILDYILAKERQELNKTSNTTPSPQ